MKNKEFDINKKSIYGHYHCDCGNSLTPALRIEHSPYTHGISHLHICNKCKSIYREYEDVHRSIEELKVNKVSPFRWFT